MLFETMAEYDAEIKSVRDDMRRIMHLGQQHSSGSAGSNRSTTEVSLREIRSYLSQLQHERSQLQGRGGAMIIRGGW